MFNSLSTHLKINKTKYTIIAILLLFVVSVVVYNRVPNFNDFTSELSGDITRIQRPSLAVSSLQLLEPDGCEMFDAGQTTTIKWRAQAMPVGSSRFKKPTVIKYNLYLLWAKGRTQLIAKDVVGNTYVWSIPVHLRGQYRIGIRDSQRHRDVTDSSFTIQQPRFRPVFLPDCNKEDCVPDVTYDSDTTCLGSNSAGGDGSYSACVGNTITHQPSGVIATPLSFDDSKVELSLSGLPGGSVTTLTVYKNGTGHIGGNNDYDLTYEYGGKYPSTGAYITISSKPSKKFLTLVSVTRIDWGSDYEDISWENEVEFLENDYIQLFKVAIWRDSDPMKVSLYKFNDTFNTDPSVHISGSQEWVNYRESYNILDIDILNPTSEVYLNAFKQVMDKVVENQPANHYGMRFRGHGSREGHLFGHTMNVSDSELLLSYINTIIGKKIDFLDWSTQCYDGAYNLVKSQYSYADYILASDTARGGFNVDPAYGSSSFISIDYDNFFSPTKSIKQSLIDLINEERNRWDSSEISKNDMIANEVKQAISIYDTSEFEALATATNLYKGLTFGDILVYIKENYPSYEQDFYDFRFHYVSNKDFFPWDEDLNGFWKDFWVVDEEDPNCRWVWYADIDDFEKACDSTQ